jgi:quinohemoprotein ethanol dehydrogenase
MSGVPRLAGVLLAGRCAMAAAGTPDLHAGDNWLNHDGGVDQASFSALSDLTPSNVDHLGLKWSLDLKGEQSLEATPLAVDGTLFFTGSYSAVYAVDARSGKLLWRYDPKISEHMPAHMHYIFGANRGAAYGMGMVFSGTLDGRLIALDARTGALKWSVATVSEASKNTITGAPLFYKGRVLIGNGGADWNARGYVTAYAATSGKLLWRFYTVPGNPADEPGDPTMAMAAATWGGEWWKVGGGGGTVWDGMTYDPEFNRVYIGVGNSGPYDPRVRSPGNGDNLFLASIVALDADTGRYVWHYQVNPREAWDYKACANMVLAKLDIDGESRPVLMQSPTNGFFYVLDRRTGRLLSAEKTGKVTWADHIDLKTGRPVEAPNIRYAEGPVELWPSAYGTHNWQAMSYDPLTQLVYIPYMQLGARYSTGGPTSELGTVPAAVKANSLGGVDVQPLLRDSDDGKGALLAWDPRTQRARFKIPRDSMWNGGVLSTAGGLLFQGTAEGQFDALDASSGNMLWSFDAKLGIVAAPMTYRVGRQQFVSILVGYGGATGLWSDLFNRGWKYNAQPRRLLTFALGGRAHLPPTAPRDFKVHAVDDPAFDIDPRRAQAGNALYAQCMMCHGANAVSAGVPAPDLRESRTALDLAAMKMILQKGLLQANGMPQFASMSDDDVLDIYTYIRARAREALPNAPEVRESGR